MRESFGIWKKTLMRHFNQSIQVIASFVLFLELFEMRFLKQTKFEAHHFCDKEYHFSCHL
jgi:hypothetical protein